MSASSSRSGKIAARAVRQALKGEAKDSGVKRGKIVVLSKNDLTQFSVIVMVNFNFRNCQHQVPEVGSRQASRKEGISVNVKDQTNVLK